MKADLDIKLDNRSLAEQVAEKMEELVQEGMFAPGDKLPNEYDLSEMLHVGRSTIREAIKILESRHVLKIRRGFGTYVCDNVGITKDPLGFRFIDGKKNLSLDLCAIRMMLEPNIAKLAAKNATAQDIQEIQQACDNVTALIELREPYGKEDMLFHTRIAESTKNSVIPRVIPIICSGIETYVNITNHKQAGTTALTHQKIVDAIKAHDEKAAFDAMEQHIRDNRATLLLLPDDAL